MKVYLNKLVTIHFFLIAGTFTSVFAQDQNANETKNDTLKTESVIVIKTFNPTINDAFKVNTQPNLEIETTEEKPSLRYNINSVPVASTFVPEKTKSIEVKKEKPVSQFSNYAQLAAGNYLNVNAEVFSTLEINRDSKLTVLLEHLSSQGGIKDVELDDHFYDTGLQLTYFAQSRNTDWIADIEAQHQLYNWYGINAANSLSAQEIENLDVSHSFIDVNAGAQVIVNSNVFKNAAFRVRHFRDDYDSAENNINIQPEFNVAVDNLDFKFPIEIDYLSGSFAESVFFPEGTNEYAILNAGIAPSMVINFRGVNVQVGFSGYISVDSENSDTSLFAYPNVMANYEIPAYNLSLYGGITGKLIQNTYHNAAASNVFTAPVLGLTPTSQPINVYAGAKGSLTGNFGYEANVSFTRENDKPLWVKLGEVPFDETPTPFAVANAFTYIYDDLSTTQVDVKLSYEEENKYGISLSGIFAAYSTKDQPEAWNLPSIQGNLQANYFINEQFKTTAGLYFMGSRSDIDPADGQSTLTIDGFLDANLRLDYKINKQWQAFIMGNNLTANSYQRWQDYPVQSIQALVGAKYLF